MPPRTWCRRCSSRYGPTATASRVPTTSSAISVRNRSLNQLRRARVVSLHEEEAIRADPVTSPPPDRDADLGEIERAVKAAVERLPPRSRQVFRLSRDTGLTYPQIAETLGISIKTVETLMGRALKSIRERLAVYRR